MERHHVIFVSQGGLDFELNYKRLRWDEHRGPDGPHMNRETDLKYKRELQEKLFKIFTKDFYTAKEIRKTLGIRPGQMKVFRKLPQYPEGLKRENVIRRLMGGKLY